MAKTPSKTPVKTAVKKAPATKTSLSIEQATEEALSKLKSLDIDEQLQRDMEWCLGSYKSDNNPAGLFEMLEKAIAVFAAEKEKKTKGVTSKLITDLEKVVSTR